MGQLPHGEASPYCTHCWYKHIRKVLSAWEFSSHFPAISLSGPPFSPAPECFFFFYKQLQHCPTKLWSSAAGKMVPERGCLQENSASIHRTFWKCAPSYSDSAIMHLDCAFPKKIATEQVCRRVCRVWGKPEKKINRGWYCVGAPKQSALVWKQRWKEKHLYGNIFAL